MTATAAPQPGETPHGCSQRSKRLLKPPLSYIEPFLQALTEGTWDPKKHPDGWIPLAVAENRLNNEAVLARLAAVDMQTCPTSVLNYNSMKGIPELSAAMAGLLERHVVPGHAVDPQHLYIASGCSAVLDNLFYCLCDEGDGVLIPAPYYPAFDTDLAAKCCVHPLPCYLSEQAADEGLPIRAQLDAAAADAASFGVPVKGLLATNPNNPLGTIYRPETLLEALRWCLDHGVHFISDEIYALSVFKPGATFTSAVTLAQQLVAPASAAANGASNGHGSSNGSAAAGSGNGAAAAAGAGDGPAPAGEGGAAGSLPAAADGQQLYSQELVNNYVHLVYGLSKDWCASGLRVGLLYSRNAHLHTALNCVAAFSSCSNFTQWALAQVLSDAAWCESFLADNRATLERAYDSLAGVLEAEKIPFTPAVSGMFVWVDLRRWLREPTWEAERELWERVCAKCRVILTPGKDCHAAEPGFFRLCFAWMRADALPEAIRRMRLLMSGALEGAPAASDCSLQ